MKLRSFKYYIREGFSSLLKNRLMSVASIATVAACIFIITFSYCIVTNLQYCLRQMEDSIGIVVFLEDEANSDEVTRISQELNQINHVTMVTYISPDQAMEEFMEDYDIDAGIMDGFSGENNPLSASFEITVDSLENQSGVLAEIENISGVRHTLNASSATDMLLKINKAVSIFGIVVILLLGVISVVIITNTIKISVYTRRNEISIMKYVGATDWFIRWPFIIEGMLIGIIGAVIPMVICWPAYSRIVDAIYTNLPIIQTMVTLKYPVEIFSVLLPVALLAGILLGVLGSVASIRKHLRV